MNKGIGTILFIVGSALIIYGFTAPATVNADIVHRYFHPLTTKILCLLLTGSGAVVVGASMALPNSKKF